MYARFWYSQTTTLSWLLSLLTCTRTRNIRLMCEQIKDDQPWAGQQNQNVMAIWLLECTYTKPKSLNCVYGICHVQQKMHASLATNLTFYVRTLFFCCRLAAEVASTIRQTSLCNGNIGASQLALACKSYGS